MGNLPASHVEKNQRESVAQKKLGETVNIEFATKHNWEKMDVGKRS
jgi:hypothetical protein